MELWEAENVSRYVLISRNCDSLTNKQTDTLVFYDSMAP